MSQDDPFAPFADDDRTVLRPTPGGRRRAEAESPAGPAPAAYPAQDPETEARRISLYVENPLVSSALSLLSLVTRLRNMASHAAVDDLQKQLVGALRNFENRALQQGVAQDQVRIASYALCSLLDETILNTPWGAQSNWGHQSLLVIFHKEAWGGEKFFQILARAMQQPANSLQLLELLYLCLSLGFEGKYRVAPNGLNTLEQLRGELYRLILSLRGDFERELSPRWQGIKDARNLLTRYVPLWVVAAASAALLILVYLGYAFAVNATSDPVYKALFALAKVDVPMVRPEVRPTLPPPQPVLLDRYQRLLAPEIARKMIEVVDDHTLRIYNSFASGSDRLRPDFVPMLAKIGKELENGQEQVLVTGHTDSQPMFSARFPSNWHLSNARARNVAAMLFANPALAERVRSEGRADTETLFPNDTPAHRALNRRVDILIK